MYKSEIGGERGEYEFGGVGVLGFHGWLYHSRSISYQAGMPDGGSKGMMVTV